MRPATEPQRTLALNLGVQLPLEASVEEASELISLAPATAKQHLQASVVGLELSTSTTYGEAKREIAKAYTKAGKRTIMQLRIRVGDVLLKDGVLWEVRGIFKGCRLSLKPVRPTKSHQKVIMVPTGEAGKVFSAFTFRDSQKVDVGALAP